MCHEMKFPVFFFAGLVFLLSAILIYRPAAAQYDNPQNTRKDRNQVFRLMTELREENPAIGAPGKGQSARYVYETD